MGVQQEQVASRRAVLAAGVVAVATVLVGGAAVRALGADGATGEAPVDAGVGPDGDPLATTTPNGWPVLAADATHVVRAAGRDLRLRPGPVSVVMAEFVRRFDARVERVARGELDDWSYARRAVRGTTAFWSEHAAGTAVDLNATRHVQGVRGTFSRSDERALRRLLDRFDGVVAWGGDFDVPDEMHFEIAVPPGARRLRALADRLA